MKLFANVGDYPIVVNLDICDLHASPYTATSTAPRKYNRALVKDGQYVDLYKGVPFLNEVFQNFPLAVEFAPIQYDDTSGDWVSDAPKDPRNQVNFEELAATLSNACATNYATQSRDVEGRKVGLGGKLATEVSLTELSAWEVAERVYVDLSDVIKTAVGEGNDGLNKRHTLRYGVYTMANADKYCEAVKSSIANHADHMLFARSRDVDNNDHEEDILMPFRADPEKNAKKMLDGIDSYLDKLVTTENKQDGDYRNVLITDMHWHRSMITYMLEILKNKDKYEELAGRVAFIYCKGPDEYPRLIVNTKLAPFAFTSHTNVTTMTQVKSLIDSRSTYKNCDDEFVDTAFAASNDDTFVDLGSFVKSTKLDSDVSGLILYPALLLPRVSSKSFASVLPKAYARSMVMADYVDKSSYFKLLPDATLTDDWQTYRNKNRLSPITSLQAHKAAELYDCIGYMFAKVTIDSQDYFNWSIFDVLASLNGTTPLVVWNNTPTDISIHYSCAAKGADATLTIESKGKVATIELTNANFGEITSDETYVEFIKFMKDYTNQAGVLLVKSDLAEKPNVAKQVIPSNIFFENAGITWCKMGRGAYLSCLAWDPEYVNP